MKYRTPYHPSAAKRKLQETRRIESETKKP